MISDTEIDRVMAETGMGLMQAYRHLQAREAHRNRSAHPYSPASYGAYNELNRRIAARMASEIFPDFDDDRRRIRAGREQRDAA